MVMTTCISHPVRTLRDTPWLLRSSTASSTHGSSCHVVIHHVHFLFFSESSTSRWYWRLFALSHSETSCQCSACPALLHRVSMISSWMGFILHTERLALMLGECFFRNDFYLLLWRNQFLLTYFVFCLAVLESRLYTNKYSSNLILSVSSPKLTYESVKSRAVNRSEIGSMIRSRKFRRCIVTCRSSCRLLS